MPCLSISVIINATLYLGHWQWLPLPTGLVGFIGFYLFSGEDMTAMFLVFRTLFALGLIGLGLTLWLEKPIQPGKQHGNVKIAG